MDSCLHDTVAESAGIIYDDSFALGILGLNTKTCGGWLDYFDPPTAITKWHPAERTPFERSAVPTDFGSQLRAYTADFSRPWVRRVGRIEATEIAPLPRKEIGDDGEIQGSRIALYGCRAGRILEVLKTVVLAEDLPYPTFDGAWFRSPEGRQRALRPYYEVGRFDPEMAAETRYLARRMGIRFIYGDGAFANFQGDFRFKCFEDSYADFKQQITDQAAREGLLTGAHSRTVEIDPGLSIVQGAANVKANSHVFKRVPLLKPMAKDQTGPLPIESGALTPLARRVLIDDEVILLVKNRKARRQITIRLIGGARKARRPPPTMQGQWFLCSHTKRPVLCQLGLYVLQHAAAVHLALQRAWTRRNWLGWKSLRISPRLWRVSGG